MDKTKTYLDFSNDKFYIDENKKVFHNLVEEKSKKNHTLIYSFTVCGAEGKFKIQNANSQYSCCKSCKLVIKEYNKKT